MRKVFLAKLDRHLPLAIRCIAFSAYLGGTFALSALSDIAALASLHLYVFHFMIASIYRAHVGLLYALFNVFRGAWKRMAAWNPLHGEHREEVQHVAAAHRADRLRP
jgi:hypothetical protein